MALNLVRNSKVFFTTNLDATGQVAATGFTAANTYEIQVLDGFTFSQNTNQDTVTINEAGAAPVRGQRAFNTSLAPVDFSFSNYIRPKNATTAITAEESVLWNALVTDQPISTANTLTVTGISAVTYTFTAGVGTLSIAGTGMANLPAIGDIVVVGGIATTTPAGNQSALNVAGTVVTSLATSITITLTNPITTAITATTLSTTGTLKLYKSSWAPVDATYSYVSVAGSEKHQLQKFGMVFMVDQVVYAVDNAAMTQVSIDFGLDQIATAAWSGQGTTLRQLATGATAVAGTFSGLTGSYTVKVTDAAYITNKLSTVDLKIINSLKNSAGTSFAAPGDTYAIPITGGNITINNNITYITPANLGVVNTPVTYYTGTRAISGSLNAYLRTGGTKDTGELLADMLSSASATIEPMVGLSIGLGGKLSTQTRLAIEIPAATISIPSIDVQQVVSTVVNFTAQGYVPSTTADANAYDLTRPSDIAVRYYAV